MDFLTNHSNIIIELASITLIVFLSFKFINIFNKKIKCQNSHLTRFLPLITKILKIVIVFIAVATLLQNHGYSVTSLIAGFGITGLAVGFAAKETIANVFGSFSVLSDATYDLGDYIAINQTLQGESVEGVVQEINLRSTKIRCKDNSIIVIPNSLMANGIVKNLGCYEN